jgi:thiol:disulfide interchange protein DsbC
MNTRLLLACCTLFAGFAAYADGSTEQAIKSTLEKRFPEVKIESVNPSAAWQGLYEVVTDGEIAYTTKDAKLLFSGKVIDTETKEDLTRRRWNEHLRIDFTSLPVDDAIKIVKGDGTRKLAIFEDPLCPYCAQLEKQLVGVDNITLFVFLYPLEDLHKGATQIATQIWCADDRAAAWTSWMRDRKTVDENLCSGDPVQRVQALAEKLKINSTPTMYFENGDRGSGATTAERLESKLAAVDKQKQSLARKN